MPDFSIQDNIAELTTDHEMVESEFAFVSEHGFDHRPFVAMLHIMPRIRDAIFEAFIGDLDKVYDTYNR